MAVRYDWSAEQVKFAPQVYFLSRTIGALLGTFLLARISGIRYFRVNIIACAASLLLLMFVDGATLNLLCIGGIGFLPLLFSLSLFLSFSRMSFKDESDFRSDDNCRCRWWGCNSYFRICN